MLQIQASAQSKENIDIPAVLDVQKIFAVYVAVETKREVVSIHHEMSMGKEHISDNSRADISRFPHQKCIDKKFT